MAVSSVPKPRRRQLAAIVSSLTARGGLIVGLAIPLLFLHRDYQPTLTISLGSSRPQAMLSDFAVLVVVLAALGAGITRGFAPLRPAVPLWAPAAALGIWIVAALAYGAERFAAYPATTHAITAAKWLEYALLAPALPLLLRRRRDLDTMLWCLGLWSAAATIVGVLQFFGAGIAQSGTFGHRQASFLGSEDFSVLSGAALVAGLAAWAVTAARLDRRLRLLLLASGAVGTIVAGSLSGLLGVATALLAIAIVAALRPGTDRRALAAVAVSLAVVAAGSVAIRSSDLSAYGDFLGGAKVQAANPNKVQTYAHRTTLVWIGYRIWRDHPILGIGWLGSDDPYGYMPYIAAAKQRFPHESPLAFPTPTRSYGIQNSYVQALADMGLIGLVLWLAPFAASLWLAWRVFRDDEGDARLAAALGGAWTLLALWCLTAVGFVAGLPVDAFLWLTFGLVATSAAWRRVGV